MAFDLKAILRLDDKMSDPLRRVQREMQRSQRAIDQMRNSMSKAGGETSKAGSAFSRMGGAVGGALKNVFSLRSGLLGLVGAYASVSTAQKIFESTVGEAMKREVSAITINTMFDTEEAGNAYQKMMKDMALESPVLSYGDMADGSKRVLALTRDMKTLENVWKNVEKLQAFAPDKSTDDAIRGIAELASGDIVSLKEVFNLDKSQLNALKDLSFPEQVAGLTKMLEGMKITDELIEKVGNTTSAKLNQVKEKFQDIFANIGGPSLDVLKDFFDDVLKRLDGPDAARFAQIGANWIKNILTGLTSAVTGIYDWFANITKDPEFQKQTTVYGKVKFVIDDIYQRFLDWLADGGNKKIEDTAKVLLQTVAAAIDSSMHVIAPIAIKVGKALGDGLVQGFNEAVSGSLVLSALGGTGTQQEYAQKQGGNIASRFIANQIKKFKSSQPESNNGGLDYVPYTNYQASLGKGEAVLSRGEADQWRSGKSIGGGNSYNFYFTPSAGSTQQQAKEMFNYFVREIEAAGGAGAG